MPTREQLEGLLEDPVFRRQFVDAYVQEMIAAQVRATREDRGWTQEELGKAASRMSQVQVSRLENPDYSGASVNSLKRLAQAFDVGLIVRFAPINEFVDWVAGAEPARLVPPRYSEGRDRERIHPHDSLSLADESLVSVSYDALSAFFNVVSASKYVGYNALTAGYPVPCYSMGANATVSITSERNEESENANALAA